MARNAATTPGKPRRRRRLALPITLAILLLFLWHWWSGQPKQLYVMAEYPRNNRPPLTSDAGFITCGEKGHFTAYDWDGRKRWEINTNTWADGYLSSDGKSFVTTEAIQTDAIKVTGWQNEVQLWHVVVPRPPVIYGSAHIYFIDTHRLMVVYYTGGYPGYTTIYLLKSGQFAARGYFSGHYSLAADASCVKQFNSYYIWQQRGSILTLQYKWMTRHEIWPVSGGLAVTASGDVYGLKGLVYKNTAEWSFDWMSFDIRSRNFAHILQIKSLDSETRPSTMRIFTPNTQQSWAMRFHMGIDDGIISNDGRYVLLDIFPAYPRAIDDWYLPHREMLAIYERPGKFCAYAVFDSRRLAWKFGNRIIKSESFHAPSNIALPSCGHRLLFTTNDNPSPDLPWYHTYLLRW